MRDLSVLQYPNSGSRKNSKQHAYTSSLSSNKLKKASIFFRVSKNDCPVAEEVIVQGIRDCHFSPVFQLS